ncbi:MAG: glucose-6-phosphate isomerase [Bacteroidales bacterium]|jgi:glucose-6-phosphate isomerase|nr:glucose-6-phosphate isomerase [Bacteroidales bacterium]
MIKINTKFTGFLANADEVKALNIQLLQAQNDLLNKTGKGNDFLGWVDLPDKTTPEFLQDIKDTAQKLREKSEIFVVIGIGGSYLGARAVIEALQSPFAAMNYKKGEPFIVYAGHNLSEDYMSEILALLDKKDYSLTVISKSGTTTEPAIAFRILKNHLEKKYGKEEAKSRIVAITDKERGALKALATKESYKTYIVPDNVGGRYSVLTPVGLLPIAVAGFNIDKLVEGAVRTKLVCFDNMNEQTPSRQYAALRNILYSKGKKIEIMVNYDPRLYYFTEWWKQLYGESEGKESKGIFPAGVNNTSDLHSMGQYIQEGERILFETLLSVDDNQSTVEVPFDEESLDGMNFVAGKRLGYINSMAQLGTMMAHKDGGVPTIHISVPRLDEEILGELIYFYEFACGLSGYLLDVNPFNQPGVEAYKKNMFRLLER